MTTTSPIPPAPPVPPAPAARPAGPGLAIGGRPTLAVLVLAAVLFDLMMTTELGGWAGIGAVAATVAALIVSGRMTSRQARIVAVAALAPALFFALRASGWVLWLDALAVAALLAVAAAVAPGGDLLDTRFTTMARHVASLAWSIVFAPVAVVQLVIDSWPPASGEGRPARLAALARGLALAVPVVGLIAWALASGDAVFASFVSVDIDLGHLYEHAAFLFVGTWLVAGVLAHAARARVRRQPSRRALFGSLEGSVVLGGLIAVYALFALARLLVATKGDVYVLETTGLTYAEYARSGFFQLLGAAALTVVVLLVLRSTVDLPSPASRRTFAVLAALAVTLTLVMVQSATIRLSLYDAAFGMTMLRLYSTIFAWWVGAVLVLVGLSLCGVRAERSWLPAAVAASALLVLLAVNVTDPERVVMNRNLDRYHETGRLDLDHALTMSDDAEVILIQRRGELDEGLRMQVAQRVCSVYRRHAEPSLNLSVRAGIDARAGLCRPD